MNIIRAEHLGMCFGVRDAIALAEQHSDKAPTTILGELVHNETVLADLRARGVMIEQNLQNVATANVLITAHGASDKTIRAVKEKGHTVSEATCPLVHHAHRSLRKLVKEGYHPVIIGKRDHVEVRGMTEDLASFDVVLSTEDIVALAEQPRFGVVSQTTQPIERVHYLVQLMRQLFPRSEVRFLDTVCQPTKQRQSAAIELAQKCDVVVVIGGANSNNTKELVATCKRSCSRVHHVQFAEQLDPSWFQGAETVGITAGTSTPDQTIDSVEQRIREICTSVEARNLVSAHSN